MVDNPDMLIVAPVDVFETLKKLIYVSSDCWRFFVFNVFKSIASVCFNVCSVVIVVEWCLFYFPGVVCFVTNWNV